MHFFLWNVDKLKQVVVFWGKLEYLKVTLDEIQFQVSDSVKFVLCFTSIMNNTSYTYWLKWSRAWTITISFGHAPTNVWVDDGFGL